MSKEVHVVSKQEQYGRTKGYGLIADNLFKILQCLACDLYSEENDSFEVTDSDYKRAILILKKIANNEELTNLDDGFNPNLECDISTILSIIDKNNKTKSVKYTIDDIIEYMEKCWKERDKDYNCIKFVIF